MPSPEIEEFAVALVRHVRDASIRNCDAALQTNASSPVARRWNGLDASTSDLGVVIPDVVDETVFNLLHAIDQGALRLRHVTSDGRQVDLTEKGLGELAGWYMGSGGWRTMFSAERYVDDSGDLDREGDSAELPECTEYSEELRVRSEHQSEAASRNPALPIAAPPAN
jgi:hypothetical protein